MPLAPLNYLENDAKAMINSGIQVSEEIGLYLDELRAATPGMGEVWLTGAHANDTRSPSATWDLLVFADEDTLEALRRDEDRQRPDVCVLVVLDGDRFESAWGESRAGRLSEWGWRCEDASTASYTTGGNQTAPQQAVRVR